MLWIQLTTKLFIPLANFMFWVVCNPSMKRGLDELARPLLNTIM